MNVDAVDSSLVDPVDNEVPFDPVDIVGRLVEVTYPKGTIGGLVTGYYRQSLTFRIDFSLNGTRPKSDTGSIQDNQFSSRRCSHDCPIRLEEKLMQSPMAMQYFNPLLTKFKKRRGKVGYMLGKIMKSDWGEDGVFLGLLVNYAVGNRFKVVYADGDDEWGIFGGDFKFFELEDGGRRKVEWFDLYPDELHAAGQHKIQQQNAESKKNDEDQKMDPIQEGTMEAVRKPRESDNEEVTSTGPSKPTGAFSSAFFKSSGMHQTKNEAKQCITTDASQQHETMKDNPQNRITKRERHTLDGAVPSGEGTKIEGMGSIKRSHEEVNGTVEGQGLAKIRRQIQEDVRKASNRHAVLLSEQTTTMTENPSCTTKSGEGSKDAMDIDTKTEDTHPSDIDDIQHAMLQGMSIDSPVRNNEPSGANEPSGQPSAPKSHLHTQKSAFTVHCSQLSTRDDAEITPPIPSAPIEHIAKTPTEISPKGIKRSTCELSTSPKSDGLEKHSSDQSTPSCREYPPPAPSHSPQFAPNKSHDRLASIPYRHNSGEGMDHLRIDDSKTTSMTSPTVTSPKPRQPTYSSIEIGLEVHKFEKQLDDLTHSRERIARATTMAANVAHCGGAKRAIDAVVMQIKEPVGSERRVALFYLLDSILQYAHKDKLRSAIGRSSGETVVFLELVESRLKEMVHALADDYDSYIKMEKVLELWKERGIFLVHSMDTALGWLHEHADKHTRAIEDDQLRSHGYIPHYVRDVHGPSCRRLVLKDIFATIPKLSHYWSLPEALSHATLPKFKKADWDTIDRALQEESQRDLNGQRDRWIGSLEDGEIPLNPPLPPGSPPPLPPPSPDIDDPNFIPPLPSSPPPPLPSEHSRQDGIVSYPRYDHGGHGMPRSFSDRDRRPSYRFPSRDRAMDPRQPRSYHPSFDRRHQNHEWDGKSMHHQERYREDQRFRSFPAAPPYPPNHRFRPQMPRLPLTGHGYPHPPQLHQGQNQPGHHDMSVSRIASMECTKEASIESIASNPVMTAGSCMLIP